MSFLRALCSVAQSLEASQSLGASPSFAEYESCFEGEGFEDFGSWNPVSIDDIITNCQQFEVDDDKIRSLDILRAVATGERMTTNQTMHSNPTLEWHGKSLNLDDDLISVFHEKTPVYWSLVLLGKVELEGDLKEQRILTALQQLESSETNFSSKPAIQRPTCYAPLFPIIHMPTHFQTHFELDHIVRLIGETLQEKEISFRFNASECTWTCSFLNNASHGSFVIRVYRFPAKLGNPNHVVEMQRLDGDAWIFRSVYEMLNKKLRDERIEEAVPSWPRPADWSAPADSVMLSTGVAEAVLHTAPVKTAGASEFPAEADKTESPPLFEVPSLANLKLRIVATLRHGRLSAVVESTQLVCSIYSEKALGDPEEVDAAIAKELMIIVFQSETNSDWASQHAVLALTCMSFNTKYCMLMFATGELGEEFLRAILALGAPGTFNTKKMRCKCVELLNNLVGANPDYVYGILGENKVCNWQKSKFVVETLNAVQERAALDQANAAQDQTNAAQDQAN